MTCDYCKKQYKSEAALTKHFAKCEPYKRLMNRFDEPNKDAHYLWSITIKRNNIEYETFEKHRDYNLYVNFTKHCHENGWLFVRNYGKWLLDNNVKYSQWKHRSVYEKFIRGFIIEENPRDAFVRSFEYVLTTGYYGSFMNEYPVGKVLDLIDTGKISPWLFMLAENRDKFFHRVTDIHFEHFNKSMNIDLFVSKAKRYEKTLMDIRYNLEGVEI